MQPTNFLGIYLAKDHATVVCLTAQDHDRNLAGCFSVSLEQAGQQGDAGKVEGADFHTLARRIAAACAEKQLKFTEVAVAIDCAMFMQHSVHSEFSDAKKINQTVRFDAEEALGTDASNVAIAFRVSSVEQAGSNLGVFTAPKQLLTEIIAAFQACNLDPVSVEPDVNCLARFVCQNASLPAEARPLFALLSRRNGYFVIPVSSSWQNPAATAPAVTMRTFLLSSAQNKNEVLTKQVSMTTALLQSAQAVDRLEVFDVADSVNYADIAGKLTVQIERFDVIRSAKTSAENLADCPDLVELAIAWGAAAAPLDASRSANWRSDFMPYQGRKIQLQKTLKVLCVASVALMLALGIYGLIQVFRVNKYREQMRGKFAKEYSAVMLGQKMLGSSREATRKIKVALQRIKDAQKGSFSLTGDEAVAGKLTLVLQAFNKCFVDTDLKVESVTISDKSISISGDTSGPDSTLKVFEALKESSLNVLQQRISSESGRSTFNVTVEPKK